jgi:hypothetical protein
VNNEHIIQVIVSYLRDSILLAPWLLLNGCIKCQRNLYDHL